MSFELDVGLQADTIFVEDLPLSRVLLMNDARYRWLILVPRRLNASELFDLNVNDRAVLMEEIAFCAAKLKRLTQAAKINIGALGNLVAQLHVHVVARSVGDASWPGPVWGQGGVVPYETHIRASVIAQFVNAN